MPGQTMATAGSRSVLEQWREVACAWNERALERINHNRGRLGMGPIDDVLDYVLTDHTWLAADSALALVPATPGRKIFQTGAWVLADSTPLPADLEAFLEGGEAPIFVGFGSMPASGDAAHRLIAAARAVGRRIIVSRGWANLELMGDAPDCMAIRDVSYDVLFPRVAAVVHHGGAGTTAAAARAGVPQIITPMFGDQFYWASRMVHLGVGAMTPHVTMTEEFLTGALREVCDPAVVVQARTLARQVAWDGAKIASRRLEAEYGASEN
jgi:vancomycin aglycone glucosyltransferase